MAIRSKGWMLPFWLGGIALLLRTLMPLIRWIEAAFRSAREEVPVPPSIGPARLPEGEDQALSPQQVEWAKEFREIKDGLKELLRRGEEWEKVWEKGFREIQGPKEPHGCKGEWETVWERYDQTFAFILGVFFSMAAELVAQIFRLRVLAFCMMLVLIILVVIVIRVHWVSCKEQA
jgi:hypothetical protein